MKKSTKKFKQGEFLKKEKTITNKENKKNIITNLLLFLSFFFFLSLFLSFLTNRVEKKINYICK